MKKLIVILLAICCIFPIASATALTAYAAGDNTIILFECAEKTENTVKIDVNLRENSGLYSMLLTLKYDRNALILTDVAYGSALSSLDPLSSGDYSTTPYKISYMGTERENDTSIGKMMTLTFAVNGNAKDGEYLVTFGYTKDQDVTYLKDGKIQTKNLIIDGAKITLVGNEIENIQTEQNDEVPGEPKNDAIGWIIGGSVFGVASISVLVVLIIRKRKGKWVKL